MMMFQYYNEKKSTYLILYMSSRLRLAYTTLLKLFPYFRFPLRNIFLIFLFFFKGTVTGFFLTKMTMIHGQPWYILISEPGQSFRSQFVPYLAQWTGLTGTTRLTRSDFILHID